jgi:hypothetical protein
MNYLASSRNRTNIIKYFMWREEDDLIGQGVLKTIHLYCREGIPFPTAGVVPLQPTSILYFRSNNRFPTIHWVNKFRQ